MFACLYYFGAYFIIHSDNPTDQQTTINVFTAIYAMMFGAMGSAQGQQFGPDIGKAKAAANKIYGMVDYPTKVNAVEVDPSLIRINEETFKGQIEFQDVWFRYPTRKADWVLKGLNMKINIKESVALVGESGCGKSTTVQLLLRFYDVDHGRILVDGIDIKDYNVADLRKTMGLVQQEPILFNYNICENILYGKPNAKNSEVLEAVKIANANEFIQDQSLIVKKFEDSPSSLVNEWTRREAELKAKLGEKEYADKLKKLNEYKKEEEEKGIFTAIDGAIDNRTQDKKDTQLTNGYFIDCGLKGSKLSGGQKQRIAIARAIIRKPKILILDEATSALDEESQRKVQSALDNVMEGRTSIVIAHRLSTIEKCNRILVLESGRLVEEGGFDELKNKEDGIFSHLAKGDKK